MKAKNGKGSRADRNKPNRTAGDKAPAPEPTGGAPFDVDLNDDGDFTTPKPCLDEDELKEEEDRRF
jgi:hypothetical protein